MIFRILTSFALFIFLPSILSASSFSDTELSYYRDSIESLTSEDIISGYGDGKFGPENTITRAEILKIFLKVKWIDIKNLDKNSECFSDVKSSMWYQPYICEAVKLSILKGFDDSTFRPNNPVTVLEALAIGLRLYGLAPTSENPWYLPYQEFAEKNGILDTESYTIETSMSRGKASELILRIREYATRKSPLTYLSKGCSDPKSLTTGTHTLSVAGKTRSYILAVPGKYTASNPAKLIIALHGRTNSNSMIQGYIGLEGGRSGERQSDFIVAYPAGLDAWKGTRSWSSEENVTFFDSLVREITDAHCIDRGEISLVAHSMGAWFASKLACIRWDVIEGMTIVGGGGYTGKCRGPVASLIYQNADDPLSSYATAKTTEKVMRETNMCSESSHTRTIGGLSCREYENCSSGNPVVWCEDYPARYGRHTWPDGGGPAMLGFLRGL